MMITYESTARLMKLAQSACNEASLQFQSNNNRLADLERDQNKSKQIADVVPA
jgi:hypothetical protein